MPTIYISHMAMHQCRYKPVRKPLGDKFSGSTRKFPAAAFTRISSLPKCLIVESTTLAASSCLRTSPSSPIAYHKKNQIKIKESATIFIQIILRITRAKLLKVIQLIARYHASEMLEFVYNWSQLWFSYMYGPLTFEQLHMWRELMKKSTPIENSISKNSPKN